MTKVWTLRVTLNLFNPFLQFTLRPTNFSNFREVKVSEPTRNLNLGNFLGTLLRIPNQLFTHYINLKQCLLLLKVFLSYKITHSVVKWIRKIKIQPEGIQNLHRVKLILKVTIHDFVERNCYRAKLYYVHFMSIQLNFLT